jgi:hypothetical protein
MHRKILTHHGTCHQALVQLGHQNISKQSWHGFVWGSTGLVFSYQRRALKVIVWALPCVHKKLEPSYEHTLENK